MGSGLGLVDCMNKQIAAESGDPAERMAILRTKAALENLPQIMNCVAEWAEAIGFDDRTVYELRLAVDEACANVIHHSYGGMEAGDMEVTCCLNDGALTIKVRDWGQAFDPDSVPEPNVDAPLEERSLGGLGLFLMKQVMDGVEFTFDAKLGNELVMIKRAPGAGP